VISMRRLALVFAIIAAVSTSEQIVLSGKFCSVLNKVVEARRCIRRALISMADWRAFLIGPIRLFQRTTSRGAGPWLGQSN
jgi:hypothetical protein